MWNSEQIRLREQLVVVDDFDWTLEGDHQVRLIGGVDISFVNDVNSHEACASLIVLNYPELEVVYQDFERVTLTLPYIPGFLAFREAKFLVDRIEHLKSTKPDLLPQVIFVDGNGILHSRGFGLASHLGVLVDIPTIGIGKTFFAVDGLTEHWTKGQNNQFLHQKGDFYNLQGRSQKIWGAVIFFFFFFLL